MTDKKKAKTAEVEGLIVKIGVDVDKDAIAEATAALKELAEAANVARDALDRLCGSRETVVNVEAPKRRPASAILDDVPQTSFGSGIRSDGKKFRL